MASPITIVRREAFFQIIFVQSGVGCIFRNGSDTGHLVTMPVGHMAPGEERSLMIEVCHATIDRLRGASAF